MYITAQDPPMKYSFVTGSGFPMKIQFQPFSTLPLCLGSPPTISYTAKLDTGANLPNEISLNPAMQVITVKDDGFLTP